VPMLHAYDYAIVRVVPRVERGEYLNVGAIVLSQAARYLKVRIELDDARLAALAPTLDLEPVRAALKAISAVCLGGEAAGALQHLSLRERFGWLVAPRSTCIQTSPVHTGRAEDLDAALERLIERMVRVPR
jgi:hypothetical protein